MLACCVTSRSTDVRRGGSKNGLAATTAWRDQQLAKLWRSPAGIPQRAALRQTSGAPGVLFVSNYLPAGMWQTRLKLPYGN
jgi:hypothetical protein